MYSPKDHSLTVVAPNGAARVSKRYLTLWVENEGGHNSGG